MVYLQRVVRCLLCVVRSSLFVACCLFCVVCCLLFEFCGLWLLCEFRYSLFVVR